ncbi:GNAT family N-acetyltransferase [Sphaerisporangium rhizosphaerae]|uniref:GNAT family N-acetyltransferase n=1 Tax=Sphaerisporangium rhizosphaerae TaxID=2269375 RepID=A0ABW2P5X9_9ACTN
MSGVPESPGPPNDPGNDPGNGAVPGSQVAGLAGDFEGAELANGLHGAGPAHGPAGVRPVLPAELAIAGEVAREALVFDAEDAPLIVSRLAAPPEGREWTALTLPCLDGVVFASLSATEGVGHVDLLAVRPAARGRGLGRTLLRAAEEWLRERGVREVRLAGNPPCYAWPGIDVRYTPAVCLAESLGYERHRTAWNMTADLAPFAPGATQDQEAGRLAAAGVAVRTAAPGERGEVAAFVRRHWNDAWAWEVEQATGCHYAVRDGEILGFAAWGARPGWFGPMGTDEAARGLGVGRVLLRRCLAEQAAAGLRTTQIGWVGPVRFYARAVGARVERVFWLYRRHLD